MVYSPLDPRPFQAALDQTQGQVAQFQGQLEQAVSQVAQADSSLSQSEAQLAQARANQVKAQLDADRYAPLAEQKAVTRQEYDNAVQANVAAKAQVKAAEAAWILCSTHSTRIANCSTPSCA